MWYQAVKLACAFKLPEIYTVLRSSIIKPHIIILLYHRIYSVNDDLAITPIKVKEFEAHLEYLISNGYDLLSMEELILRVRKHNLPKRVAIITFDDAYRDVYLYAYPILKRHGFPATMFLTTGNVNTSELFWWDKVSYAITHTSIPILDLGKLGTFSLKTKLSREKAKQMIIKKLKMLPNFQREALVRDLLKLTKVVIPESIRSQLILSWSDVKKMANNNITFGAHTVTHPFLTRISIKRAEWEIIQSKTDIEEKIGTDVLTFSYPHGDYNASIIKILKKYKFKCAVTTSLRLIKLRGDPYQLGRLMPTNDFCMFRILTSGVYIDFKKLRIAK